MPTRLLRTDIDVRDVIGRAIKIRLKSVYRVRLRLLNEKYLAQFRDGQAVELPGVNLNSQGVLFDEKVGRVSWEFRGLIYKGYLQVEEKAFQL